VALLLLLQAFFSGPETVDSHRAPPLQCASKAHHSFASLASPSPTFNGRKKNTSLKSAALIMDHFQQPKTLDLTDSNDLDAAISHVSNTDFRNSWTALTLSGLLKQKGPSEWAERYQELSRSGQVLKEINTVFEAHWAQEREPYPGLTFDSKAGIKLYGFLDGLSSECQWVFKYAMERLK
jgi:hypothetical protein